jgi:hypothetical protein
MDGVLVQSGWGLRLRRLSQIVLLNHMLKVVVIHKKI